MALFLRQLVNRFRPSTPAALPVARSRSARTVRSRTPRKRPSSIPAYVLVIDESWSTSSSFRRAFGRPTTRMQAIQRAAQSYLRQLRASNHKQLVAIVGFSDMATLYHSPAPVGRAMSSLSRAVRSLHPQASTNLSAGLEMALDQLRRIRTTRGNLVVITDGAANVGTNRLAGLIQKAKASGVRIFTIGVGNNRDRDYDRNLLFNMASSTKGRFASAHTYQALCNALRRAC